MTRKPVVAGQFYEGGKEGLRRQIEESFMSNFGPGKMPDSRNKKGCVIGAVVPHAGFMFSGPAAAHVYKEIAESKQADVYILLGTNHTGLGRTSVLLEDFETPLGTAKVDKEFGKVLIKNVNIENDPAVHMNEHSIEVQIPFLQFTLPKFRFLPIVISSLAYLDEIAAAIRETVAETKKKVCIVASSDFTHFGPNYGYVPFSNDVKQNMYKLDKGAIEFIEKLDAESFLQYVKSTGATICGYLPITLLIKAVKMIAGKPEVKTLAYYTSGDIIGDYNSCVGYASIIMNK